MTVNTVTVGAGTLHIGEVGAVKSFSSQLTSCTLVPDVSTGDAVDVLSGEQIAGERTESWTLKGKVFQDLGTASSQYSGLTEWLFTNRGTEFDFEFIPSTSGGKGVRGVLVVEAVDIGGDVKARAQSDFEWQLVGPPEIFVVDDAALELTP